jgi:hypothetical protein
MQINAILFMILTNSAQLKIHNLMKFSLDTTPIAIFYKSIFLLITTSVAKWKITVKDYSKIGLNSCLWVIVPSICQIWAIKFLWEPSYKRLPTTLYFYKNTLIIWWLGRMKFLLWGSCLSKESTGLTSNWHLKIAQASFWEKTSQKIMPLFITNFKSKMVQNKF